MIRIPLLLLIATLMLSQCKSTTSSPNISQESSSIQNSNSESGVKNLSFLDAVIPKDKKTVFGGCEFRRGEKLIVSYRDRKKPDEEITIPIDWKLGNTVVWQENPFSKVEKYESSVSKTIISADGTVVYSLDFFESKPATPRVLNRYTLDLTMSRDNKLIQAIAFYSSAKSNSNASLGAFSREQTIDCNSLRVSP